MINSTKKFLLKTVAPVVALFTPFISRAAGEITSGLNQIRSPFSFGGSITNSRDVIQLIGNIISLLLFVAGAIAVLFVVIGGFWYLTSGGNEEQAEKGKNTVFNAIIGIVIIILSYVIINAIVSTVSRS